MGSSGPMMAVHILRNMLPGLANTDPYKWTIGGLPEIEHSLDRGAKANPGFTCRHYRFDIPPSARHPMSYFHSVGVPPTGTGSGTGSSSGFSSGFSSGSFSGSSSGSS